MALIKNHELIADPYRRISADAELPATGGVLVDLQRWQADREFDPAMENNARNLLLADWHEAVIKVRTNAHGAG